MSIKITTTPISLNKKNDSNKNYTQLIDNQLGIQGYCWSDSKKNNTKQGDLFAFAIGCIGPNKSEKGIVIIHLVESIKDPSHKLHNWECTSKNVLMLSPPIKKYIFEEWGHNFKYGTTRTNKYPVDIFSDIESQLSKNRENDKWKEIDELPSPRPSSEVDWIKLEEHI